VTHLAADHVLADRYRIEEEIGRGGYSVVYRARDLTLDSPVAIKLLVPPPTAEAVAKERMRREALVARGLSHPNVVQLHDFVDRDGRTFLVMEFVDGPDLARRVAHQGRLTADGTVRIGLDISAALQAAHAMGVLHRDVKPQNVLLGGNGRARLADFGSARVTDMSTVTRTGGLVGTIAYTAPEILAGERGDARSDLYGLGTTLYFALTGMLPNQKSAHLPPSPSPVGFRPRSQCPDIPAWLDDVTATLTREDPGQRFPTAGTLSEVLESGGDVSSGFLSSAGRRVCLLCGAADPFGLGLCGSCLGPGSHDRRPANERLLFLERGDDRNHRQDIADQLSDIVGDDRSQSDVSAALCGDLPLARVPAAVADRAARRLRESGLPIRITHPARVGARLSPTMGAVLGTAIATGFAAGFVASPAMLLITPLFAATVIWAVLRRQDPALLSANTTSSLPVDAETVARAALADMPEGAARRLLADFVRMARELRAVTPDLQPDGVFTELLRGASHLARDLAGLDESLGVLERQAGNETSQPAWMEAHARVSRMRDRLVQRLLDALAAMARARAAGSVAPGEEERVLTEMVRDIERDAEVQAEARQELDALLA